MMYIVYIIVGLLVGIGAAKLYPYLKDFKVSPEEKAAVQEIIIDTVKDILKVASTNKSKEQLVLAITNITMRRLEEERITGFRREDIELMASIVVDKLEDVVKKEGDNK